MIVVTVGAGVFIGGPVLISWLLGGLTKINERSAAPTERGGEEER